MGYPKCVDCGRYLYGPGQRCRECKNKFQPKECVTCLDCGCELSNPTTLRCQNCHNKNLRNQNLTPTKEELKEQFKNGFGWCRNCHQYWSISNFNKGPKNNFYLRFYCKDCEKLRYQERKPYIKKYFKERIGRIKEHYVKLMGGKCQICGFKKSLSALEFHHVDPSQKEVTLAAILYSENNTDLIMTELDKCCLLCANCHATVETGELNVIFIKNKKLGWTVKA